MAEPIVFTFAGASSQTGLATSNEFPKIDLAQGEPTLADVLTAIKTGNTLGVLPVWNSHVGEVKKLQAIDTLFQRGAVLLQFWPATIQFECLLKDKNKRNGAIGSVVSVHVAEIQCSEFIKEIGASFTPRDSSLLAYKEFHATNNFDAAFCAPGQNEDGYEVYRKDVANPLNFTTFALLGRVGCKEFKKEDWGTWYGRFFPVHGVFFAAEMPVATVSLSEAQQQLLTDLTSEATSIDEIPKVIFVAKRRDDTCGLIFESNAPGLDGEVITEEGHFEDITVLPEIGFFKQKYSTRTFDYLIKEHNEVLAIDFMRHVGNKTCFYACPPLQLFTHGFDKNIVEPVVKRFIGKYFDQYINGMNCTPEQKVFFERHKVEFFDKGWDFVRFQDVGINA